LVVVIHLLTNGSISFLSGAGFNGGFSARVAAKAR
jgi:hypothetical protein